MMSHKRQQGAVNIMFLIITLVIALAGWGLWFTEHTKNEDLQKAADAAEVIREQSGYKVVALHNALNQFVSKVGGGELSTVPEPMDDQPPADYIRKFEASHMVPLEKRINEARTSLKADTTMVNLMAMLTPAEAAINARDAQISALQNDVAQARTDRAAAEAANDALIAANRAELARRNTDVDTLKKNNAAKEQQLENQKDDVMSKLSTAAEELDAARVTHREALAAVQDAKDALDREVRDFQMRQRIKMETDKPDGKIVEVDHRAGTCWIDVGTKHMLRRGTRFKVYGFNKGRQKDYHGYIVVQDTERDRALCALEGDAQPVRGDFITNPYFDTDEIKNFYFLGMLPGRFDNQRAKLILESFNGKVLEDFSPHVDFLILGENPDPEAVGEDANPNWFKETDAYNDALRWGIEILRAEDLEMFLKY